jgi:hypothetical protein
VTASSGFDTEISISNTSSDTSGTAAQSGSCTLNYFGTGAPAPRTTVTIAAGKQINFNLSEARVLRRLPDSLVTSWRVAISRSPEDF